MAIVTKTEVGETSYAILLNEEEAKNLRLLLGAGCTSYTIESFKLNGLLDAMSNAGLLSSPGQFSRFNSHCDLKW